MDIIEINRVFPQIFDAFFFCVGACVGSFLNVCIYRIPAGKSIVSPPSHCVCGARISWRDNLPIVGWFLLRGKARCCGSKISFRYPLVEFITALVFLGMWVMFQPQEAAAGMVFASIMIFCSFVDIDNMMLPDFATVGGAIIGVGLTALLPQVHGAEIEGAPYFVSVVASGICAILGAAVGSGILYWFRILAESVFGREAMGEGDVILLGCIGAFCGWQGALFAIFGGSLIGSIVILPILLFRKIFSSSSKRKSKSSDSESNSVEIPYGPWLALGGVLYYMFFAPYVDAYFGGFARALFG